MMRRALAILPWLLRWPWSTVVRNGQNVVTAFVQIWANKGRSILTTLGIIIAVTSIITVIGFVQGFGNFITDMLRGYGTQYMVIRPFGPRGMNRAGMPRTKLDLQDLDAIREECPSVSNMTPFVFEQRELSYGLANTQDVPIRGVAEPYQTIRNFFVDEGRFVGPMDVDSAAQVVVLGRSLLTSLQCDESVVGDYVLLSGRRFLVIGLLERKGSFIGDDQDATVIIPYTTALRMFPWWRERLFCLVEATSEEVIDEAHAEITRVLRTRHGLRPGQQDDFQVDRQDQMLDQFAKVRNAATGILSGIVSISLLVGGIGIMNIMLVSVTERTREIGLRKSVGGRRRDIMVQFLTEAVVLCTLGGLVGIGLGYLLCSFASLHPDMLEVDIPWWSVALALVFSAGTGIVFGIIPAFKAAIVHPIDALRYE